LSLIAPTLLEQCWLQDASSIRRQLSRLARHNKTVSKAELERLTQRALQSSQRVQQRQAQLRSLTLTYPPQLPVSAMVSTIQATLAKHPVIIVAGDTGSGKTTQIPKICLALGLGARGLIGHTQPRRLAARSVAERLAQELQQEVGETVGYQVRFADQVSDLTAIKLMTDGILLAELAHDPYLYAYEAIIIDEAHERSLNIDFILGYLKQIRAKRPDLKIIITSATIDVEKFSRHFDQAPVVSVSGRTYPVSTWYQPLTTADGTLELAVGVVQAAQALWQEGRGDILVFLSGEAEIKEVQRYLEQLNLPHTSVLPLFGRMTYQAQAEVFSDHVGTRIVLSTNVAETSITVPNIRYVIDGGMARISRYSHRSKVQRLPIEPISQASANQRQGRCGRVQAGICVRLYSEEDFLSRPLFTEPELLRTNLAAVILNMLTLRLGRMEAFPWVDVPDDRLIRDGVKLLEELNAVESTSKGMGLTSIGRQMAKLPVDPRLGRMLVAAQALGCVEDMLILASALSIQDPRERPQDKQQASDQQHARFVSEPSDFATFIHLWHYIQSQQQALSRGQWRRLCQREYLSWLRVREWQSMYQQLRQALGLKGTAEPQAEPTPWSLLHQACLPGLLSFVGHRDPDGFFHGVRQRQFYVFPGSALAKKGPAWIMASHLLETSRLFAHVCGKIEPEWIEQAAPHLLKLHHSEPRFDLKTAQVVAFESKTLYGLTVVNRRKVRFAPIDPVAARDIFIRSALVEAQWRSEEDFYVANQALLTEVETLEHKSRRRDIVVDEQRLYDFYDAKLPSSVVDAQTLLSWWHQVRGQTPDLLYFDRQDVIREAAPSVTAVQFPDQWQQDAITLPLSYQFEPQATDDGVSVHIPLVLLNQVQAQGFDWLVLGLLEEKLVAIIKGLPKVIRRRFVPAPTYARACLESMTYRDGTLVKVFAKHLQRMTGEPVSPSDLSDVTLPVHLQMNFKIVAPNGDVVQQGRDLSALKQGLQQAMQASVQAVTQDEQPSWLRASWTTWRENPLPETYLQTQAGLSVKVYLGLVDQRQTVTVGTFNTAEEAERQHRAGVRRLILLNLPSPKSYLDKHLSNRVKLAMYYQAIGDMHGLLDDLIHAVMDVILDEFAQPIRDPAAFQQAFDVVRADLLDRTVAAANAVEQVLSCAHQVKQRLKKQVNLSQMEAFADLEQQWQQLIFRHFVLEHGIERLPDIQRYLQGMLKRVEKLQAGGHQDRQSMLLVQQLQRDYQQQLSATYGNRQHIPVAWKNIRWLLEELRVSLFAQNLGTACRVSEKRIRQALKDLTDMA
jgi:ATP-dependent helicase HrpA